MIAMALVCEVLIADKPPALDGDSGADSRANHQLQSSA
jgi:hypothetical protein